MKNSSAFVRIHGKRVFTQINPFGKTCYTYYFLVDGEPHCLSHVENENSIVYNPITNEDKTEYFSQSYQEFCDYVNVKRS